jgi:hypothetical protein
VRELRNGLDEILLIGLTQREPVEPPKPAQLIEAKRPARLGKNDKDPFCFLAGARPPRASAGPIVLERAFGIIRERSPRTRFRSGRSQRLLLKLIGEGRANRQSPEALNPPLTLFQIDGACAQVPMQQLAAPNVEVERRASLQVRIPFGIRTLSRFSLPSLCAGERRQRGYK